MLFNHFQMVGGIKSVCFAALRGNVAHKVLLRAAGFDGIREACDQQVWQQAGIEAARSEDNQVRAENSLHSWRIGWRCGGVQPDAFDAAGRIGQFRFAAHADNLLRLWVQDFANQLHVRDGGRQNLAVNCQNPPGLSHGFFETAGDFAQRGNEQIAKRMSGQTGTSLEAVLEHLGEQGFVAAERGQAIADVSRREDAHIAL